MKRFAAALALLLPLTACDYNGDYSTRSCYDAEINDQGVLVETFSHELCPVPDLTADAVDDALEAHGQGSLYEMVRDLLIERQPSLADRPYTVAAMATMGSKNLDDRLRVIAMSETVTSDIIDEELLQEVREILGLYNADKDKCVPNDDDTNEETDTSDDSEETSTESGSCTPTEHEKTEETTIENGVRFCLVKVKLSCGKIVHDWKRC